MIKAGLVGVGHLGSIHLKLLTESPHFDVIGCFDSNSKTKESLDLDIHFFENINNLINQCEAIFICSVTPTHFKIAELCLKKNKHVFIEKPITNKVEQAEILVNLINEKNLIGQVGHVERFNPALTSVYDTISDPKFIECHRLAQFNPRGNDVSVVLDLMIHDIDVVLKIVNSGVKKVDASGVCVISNTPDITNARVEFNNGCVANFTASRISLKNMRKSRFFQNDAYIAVDFFEKKSEVVKISNFKGDDNYAMLIENAEGIKKQIYYTNPETKSVNAIVEEHNDFAYSIKNNSIPMVSFEDGLKALKLATQIIEKANENS
jgi:predicted dehydrogenase